MIDQIVETVTATPTPAKREMRVVRLKDRNGQELADLAKRLFDNQVTPDGSRPQIFADKDGTRLVVVGTEAEFEQVEDFARDFNEGREDLGPHQFKFVEVPLGQADEVVKSIGKLYQDQLRDNPSSRPTQRPSLPIPRTTASSSAARKRKCWRASADARSGQGRPVAKGHRICGRIRPCKICPG